MSIEMVPVESSSNLKEIGYSTSERVVAIRFGSGATYRYLEVPPEVYDAFLKSESKGKFHREQLLGKFDYEKVV